MKIFHNHLVNTVARFSRDVNIFLMQQARVLQIECDLY